MVKIKKIHELNDVQTKWLVEGLILNKGIAILTAPPKTFKTWTCLDLALAVSLGDKCLGKFSVSRPATVLFANFEDTENIQKERLELMLKARGILDAPNLNILTMNDRLLIDTDKGIETLRKVVSEIQPYMVILDPFIRLISTVSENDNRGIAEVLHKLRKIRDDFNTAVLLVHHSAKGSSNRRAGERGRGAVEFAAWAESILSLKMDANGLVTLDCEHRVAESFQNLPIMLVKENDGVSVKAVSEQTIASSQNINQPSSDEIILSQVGRTKPISLDGLLRATSLTDKELRSILYRLLKTKAIEWTNKGYIRGSLQ